MRRSSRAYAVNGLGLPLYQRYCKWLGAVMQGNFGFSYDWQRPVSELIGQRLALTFLSAIISAIFTYALAIPIGNLFRL